MRTNKKDRVVYARSMEEIKGRLAVVVNFINEGRTTGMPRTDVEFLCLQFRKILEKMALATIAPNRPAYSRVRKSFHTDWNAKAVLKQLEKLNPDFYPQPLEINEIAAPQVKMNFSNKSQGFLTRDEFAEILKKCSDVIHASNPYGTAVNLDSLKSSFQEWVDKITGLLGIHHVRMIGSDITWLVVLESREDGKVRVYETKLVKDAA